MAISTIMCEFIFHFSFYILALFQIAVFTELVEQPMVDDSFETFMIFYLVSNPRIFIPDFRDKKNEQLIGK